MKTAWGWSAKLTRTIVLKDRPAQFAPGTAIAPSTRSTGQMLAARPPPSQLTASNRRR